jgi:mRNA degradation ribonuclease J1/J2
MIFVDGVDIGDPADVALRDRRMLSADGIFIVVATVSEQTASRSSRPEVIFRGVPFIEQADELVEDIREEVERSLRARRRTASARSTCSSRSSTTTSRRSSTTGCGAGRWCCRSSSRSEPRCWGSVPAGLLGRRRGTDPPA